ncbi:MAG: hypothetical protein HQL23_05520 [Candidatus Omnitrophica bacterium]|nr:hypothetical protein [Candidatus Omnitrophota bacterium]
MTRDKSEVTVVKQICEPDLYIPKSQRLGDILLERSVILRPHLREALQVQKKEGGFLGDILVSLGHAREKDIVIALSVQCHLPYIAVDQYRIDPRVIQLISLDLAWRYKVIPLDRVGDVLSLVMLNPLDLFARREIRKATNLRLAPFIATPTEIYRTLEMYYFRDSEDADL